MVDLETAAEEDCVNEMHVSPRELSLLAQGKLVALCSGRLEELTSRLVDVRSGPADLVRRSRDLNLRRYFGMLSPTRRKDLLQVRHRPTNENKSSVHLENRFQLEGKEL